MQRFKELYEKYKHIANQSDDKNKNVEFKGYIRRNSNNYSTIQNDYNKMEDVYSGNTNGKAYMFNDDFN
jgi:hypothetical protein